MRTKRFVVRCGAVMAGILCLVLASPAHAQRSGSGNSIPSTVTLPDASANSNGPLDGRTPDPLRERMDAERLKAMNDDRHKRLVADANKLLALATELKAEVDKSNKNELSVTVMKKAAEMEKLAKDLKERMRD